MNRKSFGNAANFFIGFLFLFQHSINLSIKISNYRSHVKSSQNGNNLKLKMRMLRTERSYSEPNLLFARFFVESKMKGL